MSGMPLRTNTGNDTSATIAHQGCTISAPKAGWLQSGKPIFPRSQNNVFTRTRLQLNCNDFNSNHFTIQVFKVTSKYYLRIPCNVRRYSVHNGRGTITPFSLNVGSVHCLPSSPSSECWGEWVRVNLQQRNMADPPPARCHGQQPQCYISLILAGIPLYLCRLPPKTTTLIESRENNIRQILQNTRTF